MLFIMYMYTYIYIYIYIYIQELGQTCFVFDATHADNEDLKVLRDKAYEIPINSESYGYQKELASMVY